MGSVVVGQYLHGISSVAWAMRFIHVLSGYIERGTVLYDVVMDTEITPYVATSFEAVTYLVQEGCGNSTSVDVNNKGRTTWRLLSLRGPNYLTSYLICYSLP